MATLIADIFVTIKDRYALAHRSLSSLLANTPRDKFRLTICLDGRNHGTEFVESGLQALIYRSADYIVQSMENEGLGPTINRAVSSIKEINDWYSHPTHGDPASVAPFICMLQDDIQYTPGWLSLLSSRFTAYEKVRNLGFASGIECIEHPIVAGCGSILFKAHIRATCMLGRREYWTSMMPIPRYDPETRQVRAKPNDGIGSGVDWHLIRNHPLSIERSGKLCLVMPGLLQHAGFDKSTWLKREMPESDSDKDKIRNG